MKRLLIVFVAVDLLLLAGVVVILTGGEDAPPPATNATVASVPIPAGGVPAVEPEPARLIVLETQPLPVVEIPWRRSTEPDDNGAAPMPFGRTMFGPWDTGR